MSPGGLDKATGRTNGVLPISVTQQADKTTKASKGKAKASADGVKMALRYLPPGMKESECTAILGDEWKVGNGKVDWFLFEAGKQSKS